MLGKTFKGLTDEMLRWQTQELPLHADGPTDGYVVRLRPEVVVEIAFDGVQTSPRYPAGVALRFARVVRYRTDKRRRGGRHRSRRCRRCTRHDVGVGVRRRARARDAGSWASHPTGRCGTVEAWVRDRCPRTAEGARHGRDL